MITLNTKAPKFTLLDQDGKETSLSQFLGQKVLLYFYPKDGTPGCTKEACVIAEMYDEFKKAGIAVLGVSADSPESHTKFRAKYHLPFTLLSDPEKLVIAQYGAKSLIGITKRISYLIDEAGIISKVYPKVDPASHAGEILVDAVKQ